MSGITVTMPMDEYERMKGEIEDLKRHNRKLQHRSIYNFIEVEHSDDNPYPNIDVHESKIRDYVNKGYYMPNQKSGVNDEKEEAKEG